MDTTPLAWIDEDIWQAAWERCLEQFKRPELAWEPTHKLAVEAQEHRDRARIALALENLTVMGMVQGALGLANRVKPKTEATEGEGAASEPPAVGTAGEEKPKGKAKNRRDPHD